MSDLRLSKTELLNVNFGDDPALMLTPLTENADGAEERFVLDSEDKVNWLLRKLANVQAERDRVTAQYQTMLSTLDSEEKSLRWRFEDDLKAFTVLQLERGGNRRKSLHLLQGSLSFRTVPQAVKVADADAAMQYAKTHALPCVETVERLEMKTYRDVAQSRLINDGEVLPGVEVLPEREVFRITFGKSSE